jgi:hypothetical protein
MTVLFSQSGGRKEGGNGSLKTGDKPVLGKEALAIGVRAQAIFDRANQGIPSIEKDQSILADAQKIDQEYYHHIKAIEEKTGNKDSIDSASGPSKKPK